MKASKKLFCLTPLCALLAAGSVHATNGMLMEGYGPISTGMGGASQAIDHGNAAMAQNPATLGMMADGTARLDVAFGILGPDVSSSVPAMGATAKSGGTSYVMPAFGYTRRSGALTYGVGMFAQGGMGTEYDATSFLSNPTGIPGSTSNIDSRSELGVGNVIFPVAYQVNSNLTVGATLKFMWSSLDMKMSASVPQMMKMMNDSGLNSTINLAPLMGAGLDTVNINFSDDNAFTGAAKSTGFGAALGATYKVSPAVMVGASYQFKSALNDMETASRATTMTFFASGTALGADSGKMTVIDFQMPSVFATGASWQVNPSMLLAADLKYIGWADAMKSFKMRYDSASGGVANFAMPQNWKDQTVLNLGMAWKANEALTLRAGLNLADNPVPDNFVHPLFPATVKDHITLGLGYQISKAGEFNMSVTMAPKVTVTNTTGAAPVEISHAQTNWQFMYSYRF
jgi:long-chain fatty acid transport protein